MRAQSAALVKELLFLYAKYGPEAFQAAARELRGGRPADLIAEAVENLPEAAGRDGARRTYAGRSGTPKKSKHDLAEDYVYRLRNSALPIERKIANFLAKILDREMLKTSVSLRDYMSFIGMPVVDHISDRYNAVRRIGDHLLSLPENQVEDQIDAAGDIKENDSSLQRWTNIIVKREG
jgi:hypothetical protein